VRQSPVGAMQRSAPAMEHYRRQASDGVSLAQAASIRANSAT